MNDVKKDLFAGHEIFGKMSNIQNLYGMRILKGAIGNVARKNRFAKSTKRMFRFFSISYFYEGIGQFWSDETGLLNLEPVSIIVVPPNVLNLYGGSFSGNYCEDSICFYGPTVDKMFQAGVIKCGVHKSNLLRKLPDIIELTHNPSEKSQLKANIELQKFLFEIYNERENLNKEESVIHSIVKAINNDFQKWWQVSELAEKSHMSIDTFRRKFFEVTGVLPKRYIEELKIRQAAKQLIKTDDKINIIANHSGYFDQYHFSRRFKTIMGISPEKYRKSFFK